jgi:hypothetical protein
MGRPAFRCRDPDGHIVELYYETEWYQAPPELKPALKNQAQRLPAPRQRPPARSPIASPSTSRPTVCSSKPSGLRTTEQIVLNDGTEAVMWMTMSNKSHDPPNLRPLRKAGRFHHVTYALDSREEILRRRYLWKTASTSRSARTSTRSSRRSSSTSMSPAATASKSLTPAPAHPRARLAADRVN